MVQEVRVECPHCRQVAEIFLSTSACVIILNCPSCCSPMMYFDRKIFVLNDNQLKAIKNRVADSSSADMFKKRSLHTQLPLRRKVGVEKAASCLRCGSAQKSASSAHHADNKLNICADDITNLRIELALCKDVGEFIQRI